MRHAALWLLASFLSLPVARAVAAGEYVWWEGEDTATSTFPANSFLSPGSPAEQAVLSGGDILTTGAAGTYTATYDVTVPVAGTYKFHVRRIYDYSVFKWRFDGAGAYTLAGPDLPHMDSADYKQFFPLNWVPLGEVTLSAGAHTFEIIVNAADFSAPANTYQDKVGLDAFVLSIDPFVPRGKLKPDERYNLSDPGRFAFEAVPDAFTNDAVVDLRSLNEAVAGQNGYVESTGDKFALGDGTPVRFWAVTTGAWGNDVDSIGVQARSLAKRGVNLVRYHTTITPSDPADINAVSPAAVAGAQRLVAAMKQEGVYTKLSVFFVLGFTLQSEWGVPGYTTDKGQPFAVLMVDPTLRAAYKSWLNQLLTTPNPFVTGNTPLAQDTSVAILEVQNEDSFFFWTFTPSTWPAQQQQNLDGLFGQFLATKHGSIAAAQTAWGGPTPGGEFGRDNAGAGQMTVTDAFPMTGGAFTGNTPQAKRMADQIEFLAGLQREFYTDVRNYLRNTVGYQGLIESSNWTTADERTLADVERYTYTTNDVIDKHQYYNAPHQDPNPGDGDSDGYAVAQGDYYFSTSVVRDPRSLPAIYKQVDGFPSIISESTWTNPNKYKAEGPLLMAAYGAMQDVDGLIWFATDSLAFQDDVSKFPVSVPSLAGQFPAAALLYRRGDVTEAPLVVRDERTLSAMYAKEKALISESPKYDPNRNDPNDPIFNPGTGEGQLDTLTMLTGRAVARYNATDVADFVDPNALSKVNTTSSTVESVTNQLRLNWNTGIFRMNTPKAQGVTGFLNGAPQALNNVSIAMGNAFGAVTVVSLDGNPIATSDKVLIQAFTDEAPYGWQEANQSFTLDSVNYAGRRIVSKGQAPMNVTNINGTVTLLGFAGSNNLAVTVLDENLYAREAGAATASGTNLVVTLPANSLYTVVTRNGGGTAPPPPPPGGGGGTPPPPPPGGGDVTPPTVSAVGMTSEDGRVVRFRVTFSEAMSPASIAAPNAFTLTTRGPDGRLGAGRAKAIPVMLVTYDAATHSAEVHPVKPLKHNALYHLAVNGSVVGDVAGNEIDGDANGTGGDAWNAFVGRGTRFNYVDADGDRVRLRLTGPGWMDLMRGFDGDADALALVGANATSVLAGSIKQGPAGVGTTPLGAFSNPAGATLQLGPAFVVTP